MCAVEVVASETARILATALEGLVRIPLMYAFGVVWCRSVAEHLRRSGSVRERDSQELQPGSSLSGKCRRGIPMTSPVGGNTAHLHFPYTTDDVLAGDIENIAGMLY